MRGLCHVCLASNVEVVLDKSRIICLSCLQSQKQKKD